MRLLHFSKAGRLVWTDVSGKTVPPYAILSHRWQNDEVLFEDLNSNGYKSKTGFRKIEFCATQAAKDGLEYFWVDTCSIDKWNLHELSKAINSMFCWYRNAAKCYVFLSDVSIPTATDVHRLHTWEASFRTSKWFTRGWTLQELIAPASVEFFSSEGCRLGDKNSLEQLVHDITSIPVKALHGCSLKHFSVLDRIAWATTRETTEPEDKAYCLLGILDVHMPASYGEGEEKALRRLQDELEATGTAPSIIPFAQNYQFVGQEQQLAQLEAKLFTDKQTTKIAITGAGGTGKSQLALELAYRTKKRNGSCSVFWIDAIGIDSLYQAYFNIAQKLGVPGWNDEKADVIQLVKTYLSRETVEQWLLILDNVGDVNLASTGLSTPRSANLIDYLPQSKQGSIVITTTNSDTVKRLLIQNVVELPAMTSETAHRMLKNYIPNLLATTEEQEIELLLRELSYLPLAIVQAAAHIDVQKILLKDYRSQLFKYKNEALELGIALSKGKLPGCDTEDPVTTTLLISLDQIRHHHSLAADYLFLAACVDRKDIPLDLLKAPSPYERNDALGMLSAYALITRRPAESALDLHRLVHFALRKWLQKQERLGQWVQKATRYLLEVFPDHNDESRSKWRRLLPHAKSVLSYDLTGHEDEDRVRLISKCAMTLLSDGRYNESEELFMQVIESMKTKLSTDHPSTLTSMSNLATTYWKQGRWDEAEQLNVQVMETRKTKLGADHPDTLTSISNLASTYWDQGRWHEAEQLFVQVMETIKTKLGADHPDMLSSMNNLASTYRDQGRWTEAEQLQVQVIETRKTKLGADHPDTLSSMHNLAMTYSDQGRWTEAEQLQVQVMETRKTKLGAYHPYTLSSIANIASAYWGQGRWTDAEQLEVQVMETCKMKLGADHPNTLSSMNNLASTYWNQGRWTEAEQLQVQVTEISKTKLGADHPNTLGSMHNLACTWKGLGLDVKAIELMKECVQLSTHRLSATHPYSLAFHKTLGQWEAERLNANIDTTTEGDTI